MSVQLLQEHDLPECPLRIGCVVKSIEYLLQRHYSLKFAIDSLPHDSVGSFAEFFYDFVFFKNMWFNLFCHC